MNALFTRLQADLKKPYWEAKTPATASEPQTVSERLAQPFVQLLEAPMRRMVELRCKQQSLARMLACHAGLIRYRWERGSLPASLEELKLGDAIIDPFTGQPFRYQPQARRYILESVGPEARDSEGKRIAGKHAALSLTP
jgi:hypothetical protein